MIGSTEEYRDSLRSLRPRVFIDGQAIDNVADEPLLQPGINGIGVTYDYASKPEFAPLMLAREQETGKTVNRLLHIDRSPDDLLAKLEAVRILCCEAGCVQRTWFMMHLMDCIKQQNDVMQKKEQNILSDFVIL
jgi:4-hydroxybutyryl-CoA dehydratase/vinylacetyl-CoA-Delta-isomerase